MSSLYFNKNPINSVFGLLGDKENDISFSVAWALSRCPVFLRQFIRSTLGIVVSPDEVRIHLQHYEKNKGITDIELELPGKFFVIIEAKRGWSLPNGKQLMKYGRRKTLLRSRAPIKRFVVLSGCSKQYADIYLERKSIRGVKVAPFSWQDVAVMAEKSKSESSHAEKRYLGELLTYLKEVVDMQKIDSNWVYVVTLGNRVPRKWRISFIDIVEKKKLYFHAVGVRGWPKEPPNYIAFRYWGRLQSIHHIEDYEIVSNMHSRIKEIPKGDWGDKYFLYTLGKGFAPDREVRTGRIFAHGRVWCMLDTLFTSKTIAKARDISKARYAREEL